MRVAKLRGKHRHFRKYLNAQVRLHLPAHCQVLPDIHVVLRCKRRLNRLKEGFSEIFLDNVLTSKSTQGWWERTCKPGVSTTGLHMIYWLRQEQVRVVSFHKKLIEFSRN